MENNRHHFYFAVALTAILAVGGFVALEVSNTMTDLALIEDSFYNVLRNGEAKLSAEINRDIQGVNVDVLEEGFNEIDKELNAL